MRISARAKHLGLVRQGGFTLIESMVATLVLVVGMMAVYSAEAAATRIHGSSTQLFRASLLASNMLQMCSVLDGSELTSLASSNFSKSFDIYGQPTDASSGSAVYKVGLSQGATSSTVNNVRVSVSWLIGSKPTLKTIQLNGSYNR